MNPELRKDLAWNHKTESNQLVGSGWYHEAQLEEQKRGGHRQALQVGGKDAGGLRDKREYIFQTCAQGWG